jgi:hypothetical protein
MSPSFKYITINLKFNIKTVFVFECVPEENGEKIISPDETYHLDGEEINLFSICSNNITPFFMKKMYNEMYDHRSVPLIYPPSSFGTPEQIEVLDETYKVCQNETVFNLIKVCWKLKVYIKDKNIIDNDDIQHIIVSRFTGLSFQDTQPPLYKVMPENCMLDYTMSSFSDEVFTKTTFLKIIGRPLDTCAEVIQ